MTVKGDILIDGEDYIIVRTIERKKSKAGEWNVKTELDFFKKLSDGQLQNFTGEQRRETENFIKTSIGDMDEYAIALEKADINVLDLVTDYSKFTKEQVDLEQKLRGRLFDDIENAVQDVSLPKSTRKALEIVRGTDYIDDLLMGDRTANLAGLIGKVAATKNEHAVGCTFPSSPCMSNQPGANS